MFLEAGLHKCKYISKAVQIHDIILLIQLSFTKQIDWHNSYFIKWRRHVHEMNNCASERATCILRSTLRNLREILPSHRGELQLYGKNPIPLETKFSETTSCPYAVNVPLLLTYLTSLIFWWFHFSKKMLFSKEVTEIVELTSVQERFVCSPKKI